MTNSTLDQVRARTAAFVAERAAEIAAMPVVAGCDPERVLAELEAALFPPAMVAQPVQQQQANAGAAAVVYHPQTVRALRLYQDAAKARLPRIPDCEADDDYAGAVDFAASEPGARDPIVSLRTYTRKRCAELLAKCRAIRSAMRRGTWQGDNGPLDLAAAQESLWHRREDRRAFLAAAMRAAASAPAMVPQQAQQQQACAAERPAAHPIWDVARTYLGWQGGTIHQIARECGIDSRDVGALTLEPGDACAVLIGAQWHEAEFVSYDAMPWNGPGSDARRWVKCTARVPGFRNETLGGLSVGHTLRTIQGAGR